MADERCTAYTNHRYIIIVYIISIWNPLNQIEELEEGIHFNLFYSWSR